MTESNLKQLADLHDEITELKKEIERLKASQSINSIWISVEDMLPALIEGEDYSENVLAIVEGYTNIQVMCLLYIQEEDEPSGYVWANCYGKIDGDAEMDDEYNVTHWVPLPEPPKQ